MSSHVTKPSKPLTPLDLYVNNVFYALAIQEEDDIAELELKRNFSPHIKERYASTIPPFPTSNTDLFILPTG
jgi:hypothetical protein